MRRHEKYKESLEKGPSHTSQSYHVLLKNVTTRLPVLLLDKKSSRISC